MSLVSVRFIRCFRDAVKNSGSLSTLSPPARVPQPLTSLTHTSQPLISLAHTSQPLTSLTHTPVLVPASLFHTHTRLLGSNRTSIVRCSRHKYERLYPVLLVRPDGSTINIRYKEPRRILMMPVDLSTLTEEERRARQKRKVAKKSVEQKSDQYEDDFKADDYSQFWKKK